MIAIVGGGLAGASIAWSLARRGVRDVVVLEAEGTPGLHASGRNAGMARSVVEEPFAALAREGVAFLNGLPDEFPPGTFRRTGSVLLHAGGGEVGGRHPWLERWARPRGTFTPEDGVVDAHALLWGFLRGAVRRGVEVRTGARAELLVRDGRVEGVRTAEGILGADVVVDAAGAWAGELGGRELLPFRRHLLFLAVDGVELHWPWLWDADEGLYLRPEPGGVLASACDEAGWAPGPSPAPDPEAPTWLLEKLERVAPGLAERLRLRTSWTGLRTFTRARRPLLGWDPEVAGLYWAAGLGGHGVTVAGAVGRVAAEELS